MKHIFIIGSKGIPAGYGGFETFVDRLTEGRNDQNIRYHVACMDTHDGREEYHGADCFHLSVPEIGPAKAVYYDLKAFSFCLKEIRTQKIDSPVVYVLACRIGPFTGFLKRRLKRLGGRLYVNPDGHEWKRAKWNRFIRRYWKFSEKLMVKHADLLICDSKNIENYIKEEYSSYAPDTCYISYGADIADRTEEDDGFQDWLSEHGLAAGQYALVVGRFVPENNYETMIREYLASKTEYPLAIVTNADNNDFYDRLKEQTGFDTDDRIRFVGTVYDRKLLAKIRENAWVYIHGHEVGGTNPSLLEALGTTDVNLLYDVGFNREVAEEAACYWNREDGDLAGLLMKMEALTADERLELGRKAKKRIREHYSWQMIVSQYERLFLT